MSAKYFISNSRPFRTISGFNADPLTSSEAYSIPFCAYSALNSFDSRSSPMRFSGVTSMSWPSCSWMLSAQWLGQSPFGLTMPFSRHLRYLPVGCAAPSASTCIPLTCPSGVPLASRHSMLNDLIPAADIGGIVICPTLSSLSCAASPLHIATHNPRGYIAAAAARPPSSGTCSWSPLHRLLNSRAM